MQRTSLEAGQELAAAVADAMRMCVAVGKDLMQEDERQAHRVEVVRGDLLQLAKLEREVQLVMSAEEHVAGLARAAVEVDVPEEPPSLVAELEAKLTSLLEDNVNFDPSCHPSVCELANLTSRGVSEGSTEGSDEDVHIDKVQVSLKCPLTRRYLEEPVSNTACGHTYSRVAVMEYIQQRRQAKCPVCGGPLSRSSLQSEPGLANDVRREQRRLAKGSSGEGAASHGEVVDL